MSTNLLNNIVMNQFTDFSVPDINTAYHYTETNSCRGFTPLMKYLLMANSEKAEEALKLVKDIVKNPEELTKQNEDGMTALMIAVINANSACTDQCVNVIVRATINHKADMNLVNKFGDTALTCAIKALNSTGHVDAVKNVLYSALDDVNVRKLDENNATPLMKILQIYNFRKEVKEDVDFLMCFVYYSKEVINLRDNNGLHAFDYYQMKGYDFLDERQLAYLRGEKIMGVEGN